MRHRGLSLLGSVAVALCAVSAQAAPLYSASWTQHIEGIDITVTNSGATCTDTLATRVQQLGSPARPRGSRRRGRAPGSYSVGLDDAAAGRSTSSRTGGVIAVFTHATSRDATLEGSQRVTGNASAAAASMGSHRQGQCQRRRSTLRRLHGHARPTPRS